MSSVVKEELKAYHYPDDIKAIRHQKRALFGNIPGIRPEMPPLLFTADLRPIWLGNTYKGRSAFLICGGPSFKTLDHEQLKQPGVLTMGVNNSVKTYRPNLWTCVDAPDHFLRSIWLDPTIMKFVPISQMNKSIFDGNTWKWMEKTPRECPYVFYFRRNENFCPQSFLWEETINWGNHINNGGGRSVMLPAIRILHYLGIRRVFLLGCDFIMDDENTYHFAQKRSQKSIESNRKTYEKLNCWFSELRQYLDDADFTILNCNPKSRLTSFEHTDFTTAITNVLKEWGDINVAAESTEGLYDQEKPKS